MAEVKKRPEETEEVEKVEEIESSKSSSLMKWAIISVGAIVLSVGALFLVKKMLMPRYQTYVTEKKVEEASRPKAKRTEMGMVHVIKDLTVNTLGSNGRRFVIAEYVIETVEKDVVEELKQREPQLRDVYIKYLRRHTADEILDLAFQEISKTELIKITNEQLISGEIDSLYYTKLIIQ